MTETLVTERIEANLTRLRLPRIREILDQIIRSAEQKGQSYLTFLDNLLEEEVAQKEQRRIETALKISGLPFIKLAFAICKYTDRREPAQHGRRHH